MEQNPPPPSGKPRKTILKCSPTKNPAIRLVETRLEPGGLNVTFGAVATPADAAATLHAVIGEADIEHFAVLFLNARYQITHAQMTSRGGLQSTVVHPREVFKAAVLANAAAIIIGHNHPSGNVEPSPEDRAVNERLEEGGKLMGIPVLDSIIVGPAGEFFAKSTGRAASLPSPNARKAETRAGDETESICRGLLQDISEVLERQGEAWWNETVSSGSQHRTRAQALFGTAPYGPAPNTGPEVS